MFFKVCWWDKLIYPLGLNPMQIIKFVINILFHNPGYWFAIWGMWWLCDAIVTLLCIGPLVLAFHPGYPCEWISLDPCLHDQHNYNINAYRPLGFSIPSWLPMWVDIIGSLLAWLTYTILIGQWLSYIRQSLLLLWEKALVSVVNSYRKRVRYYLIEPSNLFKGLRNLFTPCWHSSKVYTLTECIGLSLEEKSWGGCRSCILEV